MSTNPAQPGIYIALGANLGDRAESIHAGLHALARDGDVAVVRISSLHETEPVGGPPRQPAYLNAAAELITNLAPRELLNRMLSIERTLGRTRTPGARNTPRTLDLDLLIYRDAVLDEPGLTLPHPRMWEREFVLRPLAEICDLNALRRWFDSMLAAAARGRPGPC